MQTTLAEQLEVLLTYVELDLSSFPSCPDPETAAYNEQVKQAHQAVRRFVGRNPDRFEDELEIFHPLVDCSYLQKVPGGYEVECDRCQTTRRHVSPTAEAVADSLAKDGWMEDEYSNPICPQCAGGDQ